MPVPFDEAHAAIYDTQFAKLAPMRDALHLVTQIALADLAPDAHVLSVGAGTGAEVLSLARIYPGWTFTALDTSAPMLDRCRQRVADQGISHRVHFHVGDIHSLPGDAGPFDAATSILVSQFVVDPIARQRFFRSIADRLRPRGPLVFAELAVEPHDDALRELWRRAQSLDRPHPTHAAPAPPSASDKPSESAAKLVSIDPPGDIERLVTAAGFEVPTRVFQTLMIHGWVAQRS